MKKNIPHLPNTLYCYDPVAMEPMLVTETGQQSFAVPLVIPDRRNKVENTLEYPYDCIGLVLAFFKNDEIPFYSTGFLVGHNKVLTAAHSVYMKIRLNNPKADTVYFIPAVDGLVKHQEAIVAAGFDYCSGFPQQEFEEMESYRSCDYATLTLSQSVTRQKYFRLFPSLWSQFLREVKMVGYAADRAELNPI